MHYNVPTCKHNLISLGRWEESGRSYQAWDGKLILYNKNDIPILQEERKHNNLYWLSISTQESANHTGDILSFSMSTHSWETWHWWFSYIGYSGLHALHEKDLVTSFTIDPKSTKLNCAPCIKAKQAHKPFSAIVNSHRSVRKIQCPIDQRESILHSICQWLFQVYHCKLP